jgi:serine/threonine-protein kinase MRCK
LSSINLKHYPYDINFSLIVAYCDGHLLVYSETHLDIFNAQTSEWVQSIGLKKAKPMSFNGNLTAISLNDALHVIYLANMHTREVINTESTICGGDGQNRPKRKYSLKDVTKSRPGSERRKMISAPTNFNHISHMGPEIQNQVLLELPTPSNDSADSSISSHLTGSNQRLASIRSVNTARLTLRPSNLSKKPVPSPGYPSALQSPQTSIDSSGKHKSLSRQSVRSNNSSSTPPSPNRFSSSYDS